MPRATRLRALLPRPVRRFPPDLAVVVALVAASGFAAVLPGVRESALRAALGTAFAFVAPGYAVIAALFPESNDSESGSSTSTSSDSAADRPGWDARLRPRGGITLFERGVFSVGTSVLLVPLVGLVLNFTPWGIGFESLAVAIGGLTLAMVAVAAVRRWRVPPEDRFRIPAARWYDSARATLFEPASRADAALNAVLVVALLVAVGGGAYAVLGPKQDQSFTEFYVLGENETGGLVADDYPTSFEAGENGTVVVGIGNHEHREMTYSVVARLQRVQVRDDDTTVTDSERVGQFEVRVGVNETVHRRHAVAPEMRGERLRLQYLLYAEDPPADPTADGAYRSVHVWVNVTES